MKKILYSIFVMAMAVFTFTSCEDVPEPYRIPGQGGGDDIEDYTPAGAGTLADPYNVAAAIKYITDGNSEETEVYVKGKVVSVDAGSYDPSYGSLKYYISDDGSTTNQFRVYNGYAGPNRTKFNGEDDLKPGDEVVICGKLVNYNGTLEFTTGNYIVSINGEGGSPEEPSTAEPTGNGTVDNPYNSVAANQLAMSLGDNEESDVVYIKGKISSINEQFGTQFGNATFYISDDGTTSNQFYVFRTLYLGNVKYTDGDNIAVGDDVVICGKITKYVGSKGEPTPETVANQSYVYSLTKNSSGEGGGDEPGGGEITDNSITIAAESFGLDNATDMGTQTLADGTVLVFDGGGNKNTPKYYNTGKCIRMYPQNSVTVKSSKAIKSIIFNCDEYNGQIYNASGDISATPGTVDTKDKVITINSVNNMETIITNTSATTGAPSQLRIVSLTINYAE